MPDPDQRVFVTHVFSQGPTSITTGTGTVAGDGSTITDGSKDFVALGVAAGDVVRLTSPTTVKGQAAVVKTVAATVLTFYVPVEASGAGIGYRVEDPRQATDVSGDLVRLEVKDYMTDLASAVTIELANTNRKYEGVFAARDPVEVWIEDGDADTTAVTFPSSTTDVSQDAGRCFVGRIDRIERDTTAQGEVLRIVARDYTADLLDTPVDAVFINTFMLRVTPGGVDADPNVVEKLQQLYNGADEAALEDQDDDLQAGHCGVMRDRATGRPTFALEASNAFLGTTTNPQGDIAFATESFFDAFARVAGVCTQVTADEFEGEPLKFFVDSFTYHPRKQDRAGPGEDDPRPPGGANPGAGNPTIKLLTPAEAKGGSILFSIVEGTNVVALRPQMDSERSRNTVTLVGTRNDDAPVVVRARQTDSFQDAHGQNVLGRDRYGTLGNVAQSRGFFDDVAAEAASTAALIRTRPAKERRMISRTMAVEPGRRLSGGVITCDCPSASLNQDVGISGVRHQWQPGGLTSEFDLTYIRPGWDRLIAPLEKATRDTIREDVWRAWQVYVFDISDPDVDLTIKRVDTHEFGDTAKETTLYTITNPDPVTYPTTDGGPWVFAGARFYHGLFFILWRDDHAAGSNFEILFQVVNAYDGTPVGGGDGIWSTMNDGVTAITHNSVNAPGDLWVVAHINAGSNPLVEPTWSVWVSSSFKQQHYLLRRTQRRVLSKDTVLTLADDGGPADVLEPQHFIEERDDGHLVRHGFLERGNPLRRNWSTHDLSENAINQPLEIQEAISTELANPRTITSNRSPSGIAVYLVRNTTLTPPNDHLLKMTARWGQAGWERSLGTGAGRAVTTVANSAGVPSTGRIEIVPYARFWFQV